MNAPKTLGFGVAVTVTAIATVGLYYVRRMGTILHQESLTHSHKENS
jgi:hypothetical protein